LRHLLQKTGLVGLLLAIGTPAFADALLFQGTFPQDDNVALLPFTLSSDGSITIQSYGYAGGTAPGGTLISGGGFAPNAILFDGMGVEIATDNGGHCPITGVDAATGNCDDPYLVETLSAGAYTLALAVWDNVPNGDLADGFRQDGNPGFTCAEFSLSGNFCDTTTALGVARTGDFAVSISGDTVVTPTATPEPSTFALLFTFAILSAARYCRPKQAE